MVFEQQFGRSECPRLLVCLGGKAIGLSGKDANLIRARHLRRKVKDPDSSIERVLDLGFVGEPEKIASTSQRAVVADIDKR